MRLCQAIQTRFLPGIDPGKSKISSARQNANRCRLQRSTNFIYLYSTAQHLQTRWTK
jgi:hypothetical protein